MKKPAKSIVSGRKFGRGGCHAARFRERLLWPSQHQCLRGATARLPLPTSGACQPNGRPGSPRLGGPGEADRPPRGVDPDGLRALAP